jgi:hypothetical protein
MGGGKRDVWVYSFSPIFTTPGSVVHSGIGSKGGGDWECTEMGDWDLTEIGDWECTRTGD